MNTKHLVAAAVLAVVATAVPARAQVGKSLGVVDANTAPEKDLLAMPHMTPAIVKGLIEKRPFASITDLQFMYVFDESGTMIESSNYDAAPPVPPAYGIWRRTGPTTFEARYEFFMTRAPSKPDELVSGGWPPSGRGVLTEQITIGASGDTYTSTLRYTPLDPAGQPVDGAGEATVRGVRLAF